MMNKEEFIQLLQDKKYKTAQNILSEMNDMDTATFLEELDAKECALAFRLISKEKAANIFSCMSSKMQTYLVDMFSETELKELLDDLYMDDTVVTLKKTMTVKQAMNHIKDIGIHKETIYTCYVTENKRLMGIVTAKSLMTSDDDENITNLMNTNIISVHTHTDQEQVAHLFRKYDLIAMPVLDSDGCLVGIVTFDDAMDVMVDETNEDISRMAAMEPNEKTYFETTVWQQAKHRILWLLVLMFSATITGSIITRYENAFSAVPLLVSFIPMLMDTGGNCGSQSSTLIIRGLALGEIHFKEIFKVMFKEFRISLVVGFILAAANGLRIFIQYQNFNIAIVVALSLMVVVIVAKLIGCILPLFANKIGVDPAIMASPLITTIVDTCSILVYFNIAVHVFNIVV